MKYHMFELRKTGRETNLSDPNTALDDLILEVLLKTNKRDKKKIKKKTLGNRIIMPRLPRSNTKIQVPFQK